MASEDHGIHSFEECIPERSDYFQQTLGRAHTRRRSTHNKRRENGSNWRSSSHNSKKIPQVIRNMKDSILKNLLSIWIRNDDVMNEEDDEAEESTHKTNKDKYSIVISWYYFFMHMFIFSWCIMHDWMFALITVYY